MIVTPSAAWKEVFKQVEVSGQKTFNGVPFPLAVTPLSSSASLAEAVRIHKPWVESKLHEAGALLFRGFHVPAATAFNDVIETFGYDDLQFMAGAAPRTHVVGRIYTSNDGPPHLFINFHNEMSYVSHQPSKAFFYCDVEPEMHGETPIVLGHIVYERMKRNHLGFLQRLEEHGLIYIKVLADETDPSSLIGRSWKSIFSTNDKILAEQKAAKMGWKLEWIKNGVRLVMGPMPGIKIDKSRPGEERRIWFNHLMATYMTYVDARNEKGKAVTLGDGSFIPTEVVEECRGILEEECVAIPWRKGDVLMLDNSAVQHARNPFTPPRRVLAAFTK
ncbi:uncharacterized protein [Phyllobates terribilis]|uniref:uncharacterized protein n=1 Tax=Phyllobates terribilis TaxID=111132 RepID=UPI003CCB09A1